ncbi:glycerate kinase [Fibrella aestuarina BUZ 2]|uniref:Glycerate kinase n=1 Tax=Fibrella aestuarina BUZ 2 TaxID=1166018 RepID=I0KB40_9BACT|nr:glycerate kinase [Fibrella aestuarina]CCH01343.1 glycerate kinase [Fibrella aestuarina BUZ 2]
MRIVLAPDKFKGSLTASEVCAAMTEGIRLANPVAEVVAVPMADGGEGTAQVLTQGTRGVWHTAVVQNPLGRPVEAGYGISGDGKTAFIEMAQASGLRLLNPADYNPFQTNTFGTGELIRLAIEQGVDRIVLGIGGSATNDAGTGMAAALGWQFLDKAGQVLRPCGGNLAQIDQIIAPAIAWTGTVDVACDVTNPLVGPQGATYVYAPQKGATPDDLPLLDAGMTHWAERVRQQLGVDVSTLPGGGAAGGLGAGAVLFLNGRLTEGVQLLIDHTRLAETMKGADLVLTGEGRIDKQTLQGKLIAGIARLANEQAIPVVALGGSVQLSPDELTTLGLTSAFAIAPGPITLTDALTHAAHYLTQTTWQVIRLLGR